MVGVARRKRWVVLPNGPIKSTLGKMGLSNPFVKREPAILLYGKFCGAPCMVVIQCPHCSLEVELDDGRSGLLDCPHCGKELGEINEENGGGWFLPWICLVALFGIIIVDSLMNPNTLKKDQSFWESISRESFGFWNFVVSVIIFILLLLYGALALLLSFLPDAEPEDGMQFEIDNEFDELIENAVVQSEQIDQTLGRYVLDESEKAPRP